MGKKQLAPEEQVTRWEHIRAIENLVGKMTYYGIHCWDDKIWDEMWAKKAEDITLGFNNGYYKGAEAIEGYYKATMDLLKLRTEVVKAANPDKFEGKTVEEIFGAGSLDVNNFTTPIVELAEDMQTAKGLWYFMRGNTNYDETGIATYHQWGWMGRRMENLAYGERRGSQFPGRHHLGREGRTPACAAGVCSHRGLQVPRAQCSR